MALATLSIDLVAKLASFEKDLGRAAKASEESAGRMAAAFGIARAGIVGLVSGLSVGQFVAAFRHITDGVDKLNDLSDATGSTIEKLSALEDIGARTGASIETVGDAVGKLNKVLNEAKPGSQQEATLKAIGVSAAELRKLDPADALKKLADSLAGYTDDANKARAVQDLLGKSYKEIAPFLKDLADAGGLNATVTTDQAKQAEKFNQELFKLQKNSLDTARAIVGSLIPALNGLFDRFHEGSLTKSLGFDSVPSALQEVIAGYRLLGLARERITPLEILKKDPGNESALAELARIDAKAREIAGSFNKAREAFQGLTSKAGAGRGFVNPAGVEANKQSVGDIPDVAKQREEAEKRLREAEQIAKLQNDAEEQFQKDRSEAFDFYGKQQVKENKEATDAIAAQWKQIFDEIDAEQDRAIEDGKAYLEDRVDEVTEFAKQAARNIQDAIGDTLYDSLTGRFKDIGKLWQDLLLRMAAQAAAAKIGNYLFGADFGKTGNIGGAVGDFFSWVGGLGARAEGGPVSGGRPYLVGEKGPEIIVPSGSGTVIPNGAGGVTFNILGDVSANNMRAINSAISRLAARNGLRV